VKRVGVRGDILPCSVLFVATSTPGGDAVDDQRVGGTNSAIHSFDETRIAMNSLVGQRLWTGKMVGGLRTAGIWVVIIAITQIVLAVQTRKVAKTAHDALEGIWNRLTTALSD
jgi:hypothetical protein